MTGDATIDAAPAPAARPRSFLRYHVFTRVWCFDCDAPVPPGRVAGGDDPAPRCPACHALGRLGTRVPVVDEWADPTFDAAWLRRTP